MFIIGLLADISNRKYSYLLLTSSNLERPEIEEDDESCVVRIAPKSIKIKIKPLTKPDEGIDNKTDMVATHNHDDHEDEVKIINNHDHDKSLSSSVTNMHPKKKLAHMTDSLVNNFPIVNNLIHSTLPYLDPDPHKHSQQNLNVSKFPSLPNMAPVTINNKKPEHTNILATRNGIDHHKALDDYEFTDEETNRIISTPKPPPVKPKKPNNENSGKKGRDVRTKCDVCLGEGTNANLVRLVT